MAIRSIEGRRVPAWRGAMWAMVVALPLVPLAAMRVTHEVAWTPLDVVAALLLLGGAAAAFELALRVVPSRRGRIAAGGAIAAVLAGVWLQGAVGLA